MKLALKLAFIFLYLISICDLAFAFFCILHLYKKVFGFACSSFLKATPTIRNLLISGSSNSDSLYIGLLKKQKTVGKIIMGVIRTPLAYLT